MFGFIIVMYDVYMFYKYICYINIMFGLESGITPACGSESKIWWMIKYLMKHNIYLWKSVKDEVANDVLWPLCLRVWPWASWEAEAQGPGAENSRSQSRSFPELVPCCTRRHLLLQHLPFLGRQVRRSSVPAGFHVPRVKHVHRRPQCLTRCPECRRRDLKAAQSCRPRSRRNLSHARVEMQERHQKWFNLVIMIPLVKKKKIAIFLESSWQYLKGFVVCFEKKMQLCSFGGPSALLNLYIL